MPPLFPLLTTLILGGLLGWAWSTDHVMRGGLLVIITVLWSVLMGLWWALRRRGCRLKRVGIVFASAVAVFAFFKFGVRYEGSADGSALPGMSLRWTKITTPELPPLISIKAEPSVADVPPAGLIDMPRFMGEKGDGNFPAPAFHTDWAAHPPRELWRIPVGLGWAGFAVAGHRAITQEQRGELECITCYDIRRGKLLWSHTDKALFAEMLGSNGPRATPTIDVVAGNVFTVGGTGILNCLDLATGMKKWHHDLIKDGQAKGNLMYGKSSSPLLLGQFVICTGGEGGSSLIAYNSADGRLAWKSGSDGGSYSSPVLLTLAGREQIVSVNDNSVTGHDPATGSILWTFAWPGMFPKVAQPLAAGPDRILITSSYGLKSHLLEIKAAEDAKTCSVTSIWSSSALRTKFSTASIIGQHAYAIDEGTFCCVDLKTGERVWREGRYGFGQHIRLGDNLLLIQAEKGQAVLAQVTPEKLIEIARLDALSSKTWNPPTLAGRYLILRNDHEAVCFELAGKS